MKRKHVWVVEMYMVYRKRFEPTVGCALNIADGKKELREWRKRNPSDKFRLTQYLSTAT